MWRGIDDLSQDPVFRFRPFDENDPAIASAVHIDPVPQNGGRQLVVF